MLSEEALQSHAREFWKDVAGMDLVLRGLHDALAAEFSCVSADLRLVRTPPDADYRRTLEAFCTDSRAAAFGRPLESFETSCSACQYLRQRSTQPQASRLEAESPQQLASGE
jgi:hypothetical protein